MMNGNLYLVYNNPLTTSSDPDVLKDLHHVQTDCDGRKFHDFYKVIFCGWLVLIIVSDSR